MVLQLGVFGFKPTMHTERNANKMSPWSSHAMRSFTHVCLHAQIAAHKHWQIAVILTVGKKPRIPPIGATCRDKDCAGSGMSSFICGVPIPHSNIPSDLMKIQTWYQWPNTYLFCSLQAPVNFEINPGSCYPGSNKTLTTNLTNTLPKEGNTLIKACYYTTVS